MPTFNEIKSCIDSARTHSEKRGRKDAKYYERNWLAKIFGIYTKPLYPSIHEIKTFSDLWNRYQPNIQPADKVSEFIKWIEYCKVENVVDEQKLQSMISEIEIRHSREKTEGAKQGIRYHMAQPVDVAIKSLLPQIDEITNKRIDWKGEPLSESAPIGTLIGGIALHLMYHIGSLGTLIFLTFFDGYNYTAFNWIIAIPVNIFLSSIWPLYWLVLRWLA